MPKVRTLALAVLACLSLTLAATPAIADGKGANRSAEEKLLSRVATLDLDWEACGEAECATAELPLDYSNPKGQKVNVALKRIAATGATDPIGTLFVNPGGPGASGADWVRERLDLFGDEIRQNFDIIGFDPRGTNGSTRLSCFKSENRQVEVYDRLTQGFPVSLREEGDYSHAARKLGDACADEPLASHMSTTDVARDMEMLRRAVGDEGLTYMGFSYGTYLGQVYAGMFPDRVRTMVLDGVVDAEAWRGTKQSGDTPMPLRMGNAEGASQALNELLDRCEEAGPSCPLANPKEDLKAVMESLRKRPLQITEDGESYEVTYSNVVDELLFSLYSPEPEAAIEVIAGTKQLLDDSFEYRVQRNTSHDSVSPPTGYQRPLMNDLEVNAAVVCSDSLHPDDTRRWTGLAERADLEAPYFGRQALWTSVACPSWTAMDVDAFRGSFAVDSSVLVVGALWDPATSHAAAVRVSERLPHSTLLSSNNWGHTTYGESHCADDAINQYLITAEQPSAAINCTDGAQPYEE